VPYRFLLKTFAKFGLFYVQTLGEVLSSIFVRLELKVKFELKRLKNPTLVTGLSKKATKFPMLVILNYFTIAKEFAIDLDKFETSNHSPHRPQLHPKFPKKENLWS